jgi:hypothetical protein
MDPLTLGAGVAGVWAWDQFGKDFVSRLADPAKGEWSKFRERQRWQQAAERYRLSIERQCGTVRLLGKSEPTPLEDIFSDVYVLNELTAHQRFSIEELVQRGDDGEIDGMIQARRRDGVELVKQGTNLFILGKPGAGKTTFLKYIALQVVRGNLDNVPMFVSLKEWADTGIEAIMPFLVKQFAICGFPNAQLFIEYLLETGRAIVLFDGLDEVLQEANRRTRLTMLISDFSKQYFTSQFLVTCRIAASEYTFSNFQDIEVADFTPEQVRKFASNWFVEDREKFRKFVQHLESPENYSIRRIATTPLLLTLLCLAFEANLAFPARRAELYEDALDALIRRWDTSRNIIRDTVYRELSPRLKQRMFAHIAARTFENGDYFLAQHALEEYIVEYLERLPNAPDSHQIDGQQILKAIESQHSIFVERAHRIYSFSHLTFQEYYTAKYIAENEARGTVERLVGRHLLDNRWREVFLLVSSLLNEADDYLRLFARHTWDIVSDDSMICRLFSLCIAKAKTSVRSFDMDLALLYLYLETSTALMVVPGKGERIIAHKVFPSVVIYNRRAEDMPSRFDLVNKVLGIMPSVISYYRLDGRFNVIKVAQGSIVFFEENGDLFLDSRRIMMLDAEGDYRLVEYPTRVVVEISLIMIQKAVFSLTASSAPKSRRSGRFIRKMLSDVVQYANKNSVSVPRRLEEINIPIVGNERDWLDTFEELGTILQEEYSIGYEWHLSVEQIERLENYFRCWSLLQRCLDVAGYTTHRKAIEESFLGRPE